MRGVLDPAQHRHECELVRSTLTRAQDAHWREFIDAWEK
ncbi:MAG: hypothetical protein ACREUQ_05720 [Burkholderiales bacterium]